MAHGVQGGASPAPIDADTAADVATAMQALAAPSRVLAAIGDDPALTRRQKQILRDIYESFRAEAAAGGSSAAAAGSEPDSQDLTS